MQHNIAGQMDINGIHSCHLGPEISPEYFIPEHFVMFLLKGSLKAFDGSKHYTMHPGDYFIARKNHLVRFTKFKENDHFLKIIITLDERFLKYFFERHPCNIMPIAYGDSFLFVKENKLFNSYIRSLEPYYTGNAQLDQAFADVKREELLLILLRSEPDLANIFFNFGMPDKIDLEAYMNRNFRFNISLEKFAFLTGRSLSSFKRDFMKIFGTTPGNWLKKKRLEEAYFKITQQNQRPSDVYLEVGFEDLSHFSFAFKKAYGKAPTEIAQKVKV
jgi:AraC-like DNA-binding protein